MKGFLIAVFVLMLGGCFSTPAIQVNNICSLLDEQVSWYKAVKASEKKYNVPAYVQLAIIYQESRFASDAQPPRDKLFGMIPWSRPTSAYGFAQAVDGTWAWYQKESGNYAADRDDFEDATDFVAWYIDQSSQRANIAKTDAYNQYLAYHEGHGGFNKKSYRSKGFLLKAAKQVETNAKHYKQQLSQCTEQLDSNSVWRFF